MKKRLTILSFSLLVLVALLVGVYSGPLFSARTLSPVPVLAAPGSAPETPNSTEVLAALEGTLEQIYNSTNPSVVSIQVVQQETVPANPFFSFPGMPGNQSGGAQDLYRQGAGSGFVWDNQGHIVTNNHVVADADKITVKFADGTMASADVVGTDPDSDLAVIKVDVAAAELHPVQVASSDGVKVGQLAVAIGNPFGLENTMTVGFISAIGRLIPTNIDDPSAPHYTIPDVIQTDASINPGNSGGVLMNDQGQVIGVTAAIISPAGTSAGVGFAIPSEIVRQVVPVLIKSGRYDHAWLGISGTDLIPDLAKADKLDANQRGTLVGDVTPGSPAAEAGLRGSDRQAEIDGQTASVGGDVITAINGQPVNGMTDLIAYLVRNTKVGDKVALTILRDGKEENINVTLVARPKTQADTNQPEVAKVGGVWLGILGATLNANLAKAMDLPANQEGVMVGRVEVDSPADQAGLHGSYEAVTVNGQRQLVGGDVITAIDGQPVHDISDLQTFVAQAKPGQKAEFTILRDGKQMAVTVTLARRPQ